MSAANTNLAELQQLVQLFHVSLDDLGSFTECAAESVPAPFDRLLVHEHHMTVTVEAFYGSLVDLEVVQHKTLGDSYAREILLKTQSDRQPVQYGIVELHADKLPDDARAKITSRSIPLGRVLIENDVMRKVELIALWQIEPSLYLSKLLGLDQPQTTYGRSAMIHVHDDPVISLLEVVTPISN